MEKPPLPNFIKNKYNDLPGSKEVSRAFDVARRDEKEQGNILEDTKDTRLESYFSRLSNIVKDERGFDLLKQKIYDTYITKQEDIKEEYFTNIIRNSGKLGDWEAHYTEEDKQQFRNENSEAILADQKSSLAEWLDYFHSTDSNYIPDEIKYYIFRNVVSLGEYDKENKKFPKRSTGSVKKFPDLNHEGLSYLIDGIIKKYQGQEKEFEYDIQKEDREKFKQYLAKEDFAKLYGWCYENFKPIPEHLLPVTEGEWRTYLKDHDHRPLVDSIKGKGTGWCTAGEQTAKSQLKGGDFHVYYTKDDDGLNTIPRIAIRMENGNIAEVRGIAYKQNLDPYMGEILDTKLQDFPDKEIYLKKEKHNTLLTTIDQKMKKGEPLTADDLHFLYETKETILGFGYQRDPRILELRNYTDPKGSQILLENGTYLDINQVDTENGPRVFALSKDIEFKTNYSDKESVTRSLYLLEHVNTTPDQVATNTEEVNEQTKVYLGEWNPTINQLIPDTVEHIYSKTLENKVYRRTLELLPKTPEVYTKEIKDKGYKISESTQDILNKLEPLKESREVHIVSFTLEDIGFPNGATISEIYEKAQELDLELCDQHVGPTMRLSFEDQKNDTYYRIAMERITDRYGFSKLFGVDQDNDGERWFNYGPANPDFKYDSDDSFVFSFSKRPQNSNS